jgi:intracellular septation protein A
MLDYYQAVASLLPVLALAGVVEFGTYIQRLDSQPDHIVWISLFNYLGFFAFAITGETLALSVLCSGAASEVTEDLIELSLILSVFLLLFGGVTRHATELEKRIKFPIWPVLFAGIVLITFVGGAAVIVTLAPHLRGQAGVQPSSSA